MSDKHPDEQRKTVLDSYAEVAKAGCGCGPGCCTPGGDPAALEAYAERLGYVAGQSAAVPEGVNMGLGCGSPQTFADLVPGETVVDLGSGGGFDCFVAASLVKQEGLVIGVDMTLEMLEKARANLKKTGLDNVEFRLGEIENLPVADGIADVVISNCVINLSPEKPRVLREMFRILKPGGRVAISDVVALKPLPQELLGDEDMLSGCVSGAVLLEDFRSMLEQAGFKDISLEPKANSAEIVGSWFPGRGLEGCVVSADIRARKP